VEDGKPDDRLLELLALEGSEQVLDAGCGSGFHSLLIARHLPRGRVVATDVSTEMLDRLRRNAAAAGLADRVEPVLGDGQHLAQPDGSMDRAVSVAVWHHLDDPRQAGRELARVLRPGGRAVVIDLEVVPAKKTAPGEGPRPTLRRSDMRGILEDAGLTSVRVETLGRWLIGAGTRRRSRRAEGGSRCGVAPQRDFQVRHRLAGSMAAGAGRRRRVMVREQAFERSGPSGRPPCGWSRAWTPRTAWSSR